MAATTGPLVLARFWVTYYSHINRIAKNPGLVNAGIKLVRYEDLVNSPGDVVAGIGGFLGIDLSSFDQSDGWRNSLVSYTEALGEFVTPLYGRPIERVLIGARAGHRPSSGYPQVIPHRTWIVGRASGMGCAA